MLRRVRRAHHDTGAGVVEYAILLALIAVVCVGGLAYLGHGTAASLDDSQSRIAGTASTTSSTAAPTTTTTEAPTTTTTAARTTPTTRPAGVPRDWPANKPIPPMPANCRQPQLEDNGRWNCQH